MEQQRWTVRWCEQCGIVWPPAITLCHFCAGRLDRRPMIDVIRATNARSGDPSTSKLAALRQEPRSGSQRARILEFIRTHGPVVSREIEEQLGIRGAWKRVSELKQGGLIHEVETLYDYKTGTEVTAYAAGPPVDNGRLF
jgi:Helix-turn-helix domain